jgi:hypothetical protein
VLLPLDTVKAKGGRRLRRLDNLAFDDRCVLLVDRYDDDWSQLWWVRMHARAVSAPPSPAALDALPSRYPAYERSGAIDGIVVLIPTGWYGWQA